MPSAAGSRCSPGPISTFRSGATPCSPAPELHRQIVDVLCGLRPPRQGFVKHEGSVSWAIGRQGFIRGKATGLNMIELTCQMYEIDADATRELVADLVSDPATLARPMEHWPLHARQEFSFALALAPAFDVYVIEGAIPEPCRFTRLWLALFEQRLIGRTLILSSYRQNQLADYCLKGLIYERSALRIEDDLDQCIRKFPATLKKRIRQRRRRRSRRIRRGPARPLTAAPRSNAAAASDRPWWASAADAAGSTPSSWWRRSPAR